MVARYRKLNDDQNSCLSDNGPEERGIPKSDICRLLRHLINIARVATAVLNSKQASGTDSIRGFVKKEWRAIATVLDRFCLAIFLFMALALIFMYMVMFVSSEFRMGRGLGVVRLEESSLLTDDFMNITAAATG